MGKPERKRPLDVGGRILKRVLENYGGMVWTRCIWLGTETTDGLLLKR
jgi:hypothetical protein